jgi:hypothetical protein
MTWPFFSRSPKAARRLKASPPVRRARPTLESLEDRVVPSLLVPDYNSLPGAQAMLYLDFDGDFQSQWGSYTNITTPAFDTDGDPTTFTQSELSAIHDVWARVAEDYAPFNINVTTVDPGSYPDGVALKVVIGGDGAWFGGGGGVSDVGSFSNVAPNVSFVFSVNLLNVPKYVGDAAAHEAGHAFGLDHQSQYDATGNKVYEYSYGPWDDTAPTMGYSYPATRSLWWYGTSAVSSTTYQNDMAVIAGSANGFGYRTDDHGDSAATATPLAVGAGGAVSGSGVIERMTDFDYFSFSTAAGTITLSVNVPTPYNNLDARLELYDASGNLVASADPSGSYSASITYSAAAGSYSLVVASHGLSANATSTNYGFDVGQYSVSGTIVQTGTSAPAAPSNLSASAASSSAINLSWTDSSSNEDGFQVERLVGGTWTQVGVVGANVTSWQDTGLVADTTYSYRVRAYNAAGESAYSNTASATTSSPASAPSAPTNLDASAKNKGRTRVNLTWTDTSTNETGFYLDRSADGGATWVRIADLAANATAYTDDSVSSGSYQYRVSAYNTAGSSAYSNVVSVTLGGGGKHGHAKALALSEADLPAGPLSDVIGGLNELSESMGKLAGVANRLPDLAPAGTRQAGRPAALASADAVGNTARSGGQSPGANSDLVGLLSDPQRGVRSVAPHADGSELEASEFDPFIVLIGPDWLVG